MALCFSCGGSLKEGAKFCGHCGVGVTSSAGLTQPISYVAVTQPPAGPPPCPPSPINQPPPALSSASPISTGVSFSNTLHSETGNALGDLLASWNGLRWWIRLVIVAAVLTLIGLPLMNVVTEGVAGPGAVLFFLAGPPVWMGLLVYLSRPEPVLGWMERFVRWSAHKKDRAAQKGTFVSRWFFRPVYGAFCGSASLTNPIKDPYLRVAATLILQTLALYAAIFVAYVAIGLVIAFIIFVIMLWIIGAMMSGSLSSGSSSSKRSSSWSLPARSERRRDFWGKDYIQHFDGDRRKVGYTQTQTDFWGNQYEQHYSQDSRKLGHSEQREGWLGQEYTQHFDRDGSKSGWSEKREDWLGNEYIQHFDNDGKKAGRSETREDFFGNRYVKHEDK